MPKWVRTAVINELKTLFLRTRLLDQSNKNLMLQDFLSLLFPTFVSTHPDKLADLARTFRKNWINWRNVLWDKINEKYQICRRRREKFDSEKPIAFYFKNQYLNEIFSLWFKFAYDPLFRENTISFRNLILFAFHCIEKYRNDAHGHFYTYNGDLYTVNNIFNSSSGYDVAASMDLSRYEIAGYVERDEQIIIDSSSEDDVQPKKRTNSKRLGNNKK